MHRHCAPLYRGPARGALCVSCAGVSHAHTPSLRLSQGSRAGHKERTRAATQEPLCRAHPPRPVRRTHNIFTALSFATTPPPHPPAHRLQKHSHSPWHVHASTVAPPLPSLPPPSSPSRSLLAPLDHPGTFPRASSSFPHHKSLRIAVSFPGIRAAQSHSHGLATGARRSTPDPNSGHELCLGGSNHTFVLFVFHLRPPLATGETAVAAKGIVVKVLCSRAYV